MRKPAASQLPDYKDPSYFGLAEIIGTDGIDHLQEQQRRTRALFDAHRSMVLEGLRQPGALEQLKAELPPAKTGRPARGEIDGEKVRQLRGDLSQKAFCRRRRISADVLQAAERGYATEAAIIKICKIAGQMGHSLTPAELKKPTAKSR